MAVGGTRFSIGSYGLGALIAVIVLIVAIVLALIGKMPYLDAALFAALDIARLT